MLSTFSRTRWRSHKPAKPRTRFTPTRRHFTEVHPPCNSHLHHLFSFTARPEEAEAIYTYLKAEKEAEWVHHPSIPTLLKGIEDLLSMPSDHLAIESVYGIRGKLNSLIRARKWRADKLKSTHPEEAEEILLGNTQLEAVRRELKLYHMYVQTTLFSSHTRSKYQTDDCVDLNKYDVLIGDITEKALFTNLSDQFGVRYLSPVDPEVPPTWPVKGVVFGPNKRLFVNLILSTERSLNVFFLVNTTCPCTFVSPTVLAALNPDDKDYTGPCDIHGEEDHITKSPQSSHFADLNVLGRKFFQRTHARLLVDYPSQTCTLLKREQD